MSAAEDRARTPRHRVVVTGEERDGEEIVVQYAELVCDGTAQSWCHTWPDCFDEYGDCTSELDDCEHEEHHHAQCGVVEWVSVPGVEESYDPEGPPLPWLNSGAFSPVLLHSGPVTVSTSWTGDDGPTWQYAEAVLP